MSRNQNPIWSHQQSGPGFAGHGNQQQPGRAHPYQMQQPLGQNTYVNGQNVHQANYTDSSVNWAMHYQQQQQQQQQMLQLQQLHQIQQMQQQQQQNSIYQHTSYGSNGGNVQVKSEPNQSPPQTSAMIYRDSKYLNIGALTPSPQGTDTITIPGNNSSTGHIMGFNPLTPPGYPNVTIPSGTNFHYETTVPSTQHTPPPQNNMPNLIETPSNTPPMVEIFQRSPTTATTQRSPPILDLPQESPMRRSPVTSKRSPSVSSQRSAKEATPRGSRGRSQRSMKIKPQRAAREASSSSCSDFPEGMLVDTNPEAPTSVPEGSALKLETVSRPKETKGCDVRVDQAEQSKFTTGTTSIQLPYVESDDECAEFYRPQYNSHGKVRINKCKSCSFKTAIRAELWVHIRVHMNPNKILQCNYNPKCTFVTEYKHYLEYHIRLHNNEKPFSCELCQYTCINKSMLTSHMKSHSGMYQYHCGDCDYATKYCHSLKIHPRKYFHRPGVVLDEDGVPDPTIFIDVNGRRRGPKKKKSRKSKKGKKVQKVESDEEEFEEEEEQMEELQAEESLPQDPPAAQQSLEALQQSNPQLAALLMSQQGSNILSNITFASMLQRSRNMSFFPYLQMLVAQQQQAALAVQLAAAGQPQQEGNGGEVREVKDTNGAIDLSQTPKKEEDVKQRMEEIQTGHRDASTPTMSVPNTCRRKGRALQLEDLTIDETTSSSNTSDGGSIRPRSPSDDSPQEPPYKKHGFNKFRHPEQSPSTSFSVENLVGAGNYISQQLPPSPAPSNFDSNSQAGNVSRTSPHSPHAVKYDTKVPDLFPCKYCDIYFSNVVLHSLHMGYHSREDVFKCNMCGEQCGNAVGFSIHLARKPHDAVKLQ